MPTPPPRLGVTDPPLPRGRGGCGDVGGSAGRCSQDAGAAPPLFSGSTAPPAATRQRGRVRLSPALSLSVPGAVAAQATPDPSHPPAPATPRLSVTFLLLSPGSLRAPPARPGCARGGSGRLGPGWRGRRGRRRQALPKGPPRARPLLPGQPAAAPAATYRGARRRSRDRPGCARPWSRKGRRSEGRRRARGQGG